MSQRKRKQGQQRRLKKYLKSQTGTTDPHALLAREQSLLDKIAAMDKQIHELTTALESPPSDESTPPSEPELTHQQHTHLDYLKTMRDDMHETLCVNRRIYAALC